MNRPNSFKTAEIKKHVRPYGFQLVIDNLRARGHEVAPLRPSDDGGTVLMSLYWMEDLYEYIRWRKRNNIGKKYRVILGGNHAMCQPNAVIGFADAAYIGDGELWDGLSYSSCAALNWPAVEIAVNPTIPKKIIRLENKSTTTGKKVDIIELTRGCKNMCHFCQYAWSKPWRANDPEYIIDQIQSVDAKTVRLVSADGNQHPRIQDIHAACHACGVRNVSQDNSLLELRKVLHALDAVGGTQRFGIDGMSERLRRKMHKPIGSDELVDLVGQLYQKGARRFLAYNLFGVPGETIEDFQEYDETLRRIADRISAPCAFVTCWNAFMPMALTPLQWEASSWRSDHRDLARLIETMEYGKKKGVNLYHMPMRTSDMTITLRVLALRSTIASRDLVYTVATKGNLTERQILREFERVEGYALHSERPIAGPMPWDRHILYDKAKLSRLATKHRNIQAC